MITQAKAFEELKAVGESMLNAPDATAATTELVEGMMLAYKRKFYLPAARFQDAEGRWTIEARAREHQPPNLYNRLTRKNKHAMG